MNYAMFLPGNPREMVDAFCAVGPVDRVRAKVQERKELLDTTIWLSRRLAQPVSSRITTGRSCWKCLRVEKEGKNQK